MERSPQRVIVNNRPMLFARDAARLTGLSLNYIGKLCRNGIVAAERLNSLWLVDENSLNAFLIHRAERKAALRQAIRRERLAERAAHRVLTV